MKQLSILLNHTVLRFYLKRWYPVPMQLVLIGIVIFIIVSQSSAQQLEVYGLSGNPDTIASIRTNYQGPNNVIGLFINSSNTNTLLGGRGMVVQSNHIGMKVNSANFSLLSTSNSNAGSFSGGDFHETILLTGKHYLNQSGNDDGVISSAPFLMSSDLWLLSNDDLFFQLDANNDEGGKFRVLKNEFSPFEVFSINESGAIKSLHLASPGSNQVDDQGYLFADGSGNVKRLENFHVLDINCSSFVPGENQPDEMPYYYIELGSFQVNVSEWIAPINLPNGTRIKEVHILYQDNTPQTRARMRFRKVSIVGGPTGYTSVAVATGTTIGSTTDPNVRILQVDEKVDNTTHFYDVLITKEATANGPDKVRIYGVKVYYELN